MEEFDGIWELSDVYKAVLKLTLGQEFVQFSLMKRVELKHGFLTSFAQAWGSLWKTQIREDLPKAVL